MKKIISILMFAAVFGMLIGSVAATELVEHDFNGDFTLNVPGNYWMGTSGSGHSYDNGKGVKITYLTLDDLKADGFNSYDEYIKSLEAKGIQFMSTEGNMDIYKNNDKYSVFVHSDSEVYAITDPDLEEAKAIASSAKLSSDNTDNTTNTSTPAKSSVELESQDFNGSFKMDIPKTASFKETNSTDAAVNGAIEYANASGDLNITFTENDQVDDAFVDKLVSEFEKENHAEVTTNGNLKLINVGPYKEVIFNEGNKMIMIVSSDLDLDTITAMAQSVEFTK